MVYSLNYRRPALTRTGSTLSVERADHKGSDPSSSTGSTLHGVPNALSFDRVINGGTYTPCTVRDFMNYLLYVEHAAENLQFFLWFKYYAQRFSQLPPNEKVLSQPWTPDKDALLSPRSPRVRPPPQVAVSEIFHGSDFQDQHVRSDKVKNVFDDGYAPDFGTDDESSIMHSPVRQGIKKSAAMTFESADVKLQPFTIQPFREEITRIVATYIAHDAPRQLNLSSRERTNLLQALAQTTHPSAFQDVVHTVEWSLRHQAHPNFIRWVIGNCNRARLRFCGVLGGTFLTAGLACVVILTLSSASRPWRVIAMLPLLIGLAMLFCVWNDVCLVLHLLHHRHLRPWELFVDNAQIDASEDLKNRSMDSFDSVNSYEDEPWVARYEKRNLVRKVFDREVWIREPALRKIQDTIFVQALLSGGLAAGIIVGAFCAVPQIDRF